MRRNYKSGPDKTQTRGKITYQLISDLIYPYDARPYSDEDTVRIAGRIVLFGIRLPILVDSNLTVIAGCVCIDACKMLQWKTVPTICVQTLSKAESRALVIGHKRLSELYGWNDGFLPGQLRELRVFDENFALRYESVFDFRY
jgi:hypothetical protein